VLGGFVAAIHTTHSRVINAAITDVQGIHHVDDVYDGLGVVGGITINLHVEDMSASGEGVIGSFYFSLMAC